MSASTILVVEDDLALAVALSRVLRGEAAEDQPALDVMVASSVAEARAAFQRATPLGMIVDVGLPDGIGLEFLSWAQIAGWDGPALVITGSLEPQLANEASLLDAWVAFKPDILPNVRAFLGRLRRSLATPRERVRSAADHLAELARLTGREREIVRLVASGTPRAELARRLGVTNNTLKSHVRGLLNKTGQPSLEGLHRRILLAAADPAHTS